MSYDLPGVIYISLVVIVTLFILRLIAGLLTTSQVPAFQMVGSAIGAIVG